MYTTIIQIIDNHKLIDSITISQKLNINITKDDIINYKLGDMKNLRGQVVSHSFYIEDDIEYFKNINITEIITLKSI